MGPFFLQYKGNKIFWHDQIKREIFFKYLSFSYINNII